MEPRLITAVKSIKSDMTPDQVIKLLDQAIGESKNVDERDKDGFTALMHACVFRRYKTDEFEKYNQLYLIAVTHLLTKGCDISKRDGKFAVDNPSSLGILLTVANHILNTIDGRVPLDSDHRDAVKMAFAKCLYNAQWFVVNKFLARPELLKCIDFKQNFRSGISFYDHFVDTFVYQTQQNVLDINQFISTFAALRKHASLSPFLKNDLDKALECNVELAAHMFSHFELAEPVKNQVLNRKVSSKYKKLLEYFVNNNNWDAADSMCKHGAPLQESFLHTLARRGEINAVKKLLPYYVIRGQEKFLFSALKVLEEKKATQEQVDISGRTRVRNYLLAFKAINENNERTAQAACSNLWDEDKKDFAELTCRSSKLAGRALGLYVNPLTGFAFEPFGPFEQNASPVVVTHLEAKQYPTLTPSVPEEEIQYPGSTPFGIFSQTLEEQPGSTPQQLKLWQLNVGK